MLSVAWPSHLCMVQCIHTTCKKLPKVHAQSGMPDCVFNTADKQSTKRSLPKVNGLFRPLTHPLQLQMPLHWCACTFKCHTAHRVEPCEWEKCMQPQPTACEWLVQSAGIRWPSISLWRCEHTPHFAIPYWIISPAQWQRWVSSPLYPCNHQLLATLKHY